MIRSDRNFPTLCIHIFFRFCLLFALGFNFGFDSCSVACLLNEHTQKFSCRQHGFVRYSFRLLFVSLRENELTRESALESAARIIGIVARHFYLSTGISWTFLCLCCRRPTLFCFCHCPLSSVSVLGYSAVCRRVEVNSFSHALHAEDHE
jgi:hypothetical protein